jgi:hypothetical protein
MVVPVGETVHSEEPAQEEIEVPLLQLPPEYQ